MLTRFVKQSILGMCHGIFHICMFNIAKKPLLISQRHIYTHQIVIVLMLTNHAGRPFLRNEISPAVIATDRDIISYGNLLVTESDDGHVCLLDKLYFTRVAQFTCQLFHIWALKHDHRLMCLLQ
jgi:hypothetical protein